MFEISGKCRLSAIKGIQGKRQLALKKGWGWSFHEVIHHFGDSWLTHLTVPSALSQCLWKVYSVVQVLSIIQPINQMWQYARQWFQPQGKMRQENHLSPWVQDQLTQHRGNCHHHAVMVDYDNDTTPPPIAIQSLTVMRHTSLLTNG